MNLLERYLQAIADHLPVKGRQDTVAELRANLLAEIEGREEAAGRSLTEAEVAKILEAHGMPMMVAARYRPQRSLIGPAMFPIYWYTLKKSFPLLILAYAALEGVRIVIQGESLSTLPGALWHFVGVALTFWAIVTLGFAVFEYMQQTYGTPLHTPQWSARDLPKIDREEKRPSRSRYVADLIVSIGAIVWLLAVPGHPYLMFGPGVKLLHGMPFGLTPEWHVFYWEFMGLLMAMIPLKAAMLFRGPRRWSEWLEIGVQLLGIAILVVAIQLGTFFVPSASATADTIRSLVGINAAITLGFKIVLAISVVRLVWSMWQATKDWREQAGFAAVW